MVGGGSRRLMAWVGEVGGVRGVRGDFYWNNIAVNQGQLFRLKKLAPKQ